MLAGLMEEEGHRIQRVDKPFFLRHELIGCLLANLVGKA